MSGESLRVMILRAFSSVTVVSKAGNSSIELPAVVEGDARGRLVAARRVRQRPPAAPPLAVDGGAEEFARRRLEGAGTGGRRERLLTEPCDAYTAAA